MIGFATIIAGPWSFDEDIYTLSSFGRLQGSISGSQHASVL